MTEPHHLVLKVTRYVSKDHFWEHHFTNKIFDAPRVLVNFCLTILAACQLSSRCILYIVWNEKDLTGLPSGKAS
jgi:hypothetical protein